MSPKVNHIFDNYEILEELKKRGQGGTKEGRDMKMGKKSNFDILIICNHHVI